VIRHDLAPNMTLYQGDCMDVLPTLEADSLDSLVTDPPAGISFMGKAWDEHSKYLPHTEKGKHVLAGAEMMGLERWEAGFVAFTADWATETIRVLKSGAYGVVWALPRTTDLTVSGLRAAGFEVRDVITHIFGSGFPKNLDVSKAIDKYLGVERPVVGTKEQRNPYIGSDGITFRDAPDYEGQQEPITTSGSEEAAKWEGFGTALKPSSEHWILVRRPMAEDTVAENILKHGVGAINIGGCRVGNGGHLKWSAPRDMGYHGGSDSEAVATEASEGRWPSNLVLSHRADCKPNGTKRVKIVGATAHRMEHSTQGIAHADKPHEHLGYRDADGTETVEAWDCVDDCPVRLLDEQSGDRAGSRPHLNRRGATTGAGLGYRSTATTQDVMVGYPDSGGPSRFFPSFSWEPEDLDAALMIYCSKASRAERDQGCEHLPKKPIQWSNGTENPGSFQAEGTDKSARNHHPTVKPIKLMRWLVRLVTPPGGKAFDPFNGSGSTTKACAAESFGYVGIEREADYVQITLARMQNQQLRFDLLASASDD
jgi:DNA modification methylase